MKSSYLTSNNFGVASNTEYGVYVLGLWQQHKPVIYEVITPNGEVLATTSYDEAIACFDFTVEAIELALKEHHNMCFDGVPF